MSRVERLAEELSSLAAAIAPSEHGAEVGESARPFQPGVTTLEVVHRLAEKRFTALAAGDDSGGTLRHARGARGAECPGELDLLVDEPRGRIPITERELGERGLRPPGEVARTSDQRPREALAHGQEV